MHTRVNVSRGEGHGENQPGRYGWRVRQGSCLEEEAAQISFPSCWPGALEGEQPGEGGQGRALRPEDTPLSHTGDPGQGQDSIHSFGLLRALSLSALRPQLTVLEVLYLRDIGQRVHSSPRPPHLQNGILAVMGQAPDLALLHTWGCLFPQHLEKGIIPISQLGKLMHGEGNRLSYCSLAARRQRLDLNANLLSCTYHSDLSPCESLLLPFEAHGWKSQRRSSGVRAVSCTLVAEPGLNTRGPNPC